MEIQLNKHFLFIILFCTSFLWYPIDFQCCGLNHNNSTIINTELNINRAVLSYDIGPFGEYYCSFNLEALGNNFTENGNLSGEFRLYGNTLSDFVLSGPDFLMDLSQTHVDSYSLISFSSENFTIPEGTPFNISGSYYGKFTSNTSNLYSFDLGVDWGCMIGFQRASIRFRDQYTLITQGLKPSSTISINLGVIKLIWSETSVQDFNTKLFLRKESNDYLELYDLWNATYGTYREVIIQNEELFTIEGNIICPTWITTNISYFKLASAQKICIRCAINSLATPEMTGHIEIIINLESTIGIQKSIKKILIPVIVIQNKSTRLFSPFLEILTIMTVIALLGVIIYKKDNLTNLKTKSKQYINYFQTRKSISSYNNESAIILNPEEKDFHWQSIQTKWETILSENELKVIEVLYSEGIMNQKSLAEELDLTPMSISRVVSRLETKRLVTRKQLGISKMIKLKRDHL